MPLTSSKCLPSLLPISADPRKISTMYTCRLRLPDYGVSEIPSEQRSPSPEPIFDKTGQLVNSRVVRRKQKLTQERAELIESLKPKVRCLICFALALLCQRTLQNRAPPLPGAAALLAQVNRTD